MIKLKQNKGFTVVEMLVVLAIIAILVLIAVPQYTRYIQRANNTKYTSEGAEIYKAIVQGTQQLALAGEDPYDEDELLPLVNGIMSTTDGRRGNDTITISIGTDEMTDEHNTQTWGLVIDRERRTITHNNQVDADHNYVFVNGVFIEDFVQNTGNAGDDLESESNLESELNLGPEQNGPSSDNSTMDAEAAQITLAVYNARKSLKDEGKDTSDLFSCNTIASKIQKTQTLKPLFGSNNIKKRLMDGTDTNTNDKYWGMAVVETGVNGDGNLDNDDIIITNLTPNGLYTYRNGKFEKKQ